jgi:murein lipoprotein
VHQGPRGAMDALFCVIGPTQNQLLEKILMKRTILPFILVLTVGAMGGCASISREEFDAVRASASKAAADAAAAKAGADKALAAATKAQSTADAAKSGAESANACCRDTQTKIDRMFKKSMYK